MIDRSDWMTGRRAPVNTGESDGLRRCSRVDYRESAYGRAVGVAACEAGRRSVSGTERLAPSTSAKGLLSIFTSRRMRKESSDPAHCRLCSMVAESPQARENGCRSPADRPTGGGTTGTRAWCSRAMPSPSWTWTDFFKRSSKSSTQAPTGGLRCSTWPMPCYGIVTRRAHSSCRGRFKRRCFERSSRLALCLGATAEMAGPGAPLVVSVRRSLPKKSPDCHTATRQECFIALSI